MSGDGRKWCCAFIFSIGAGCSNGLLVGAFAPPPTVDSVVDAGSLEVGAEVFDVAGDGLPDVAGADRPAPVLAFVPSCVAWDPMLSAELVVSNGGSAATRPLTIWVSPGVYVTSADECSGRPLPPGARCLFRVSIVTPTAGLPPRPGAALITDGVSSACATLAVGSACGDGGTGGTGGGSDASAGGCSVF